MTKKTKTWLPYAIIGILVLVSALSLISPHLTHTPPKPPNTPDYSFQNMSLTQIENGKPILHLAANYAAIYQTQKIASLNQISGTFWSSEGKPIFIQSRSGRIELDSTNLNLHDAIATFSISESTSIKVEAESLNWMAKTLTFSGTGALKIYSGPFLFEGTSFKASIPVRKLTISRHATATIRM